MWCDDRAGSWAAFGDRDLTEVPMRVAEFIISQMEPGNHVKLRRADICRALDLRSSQVSVAIKILKAKGIIRERAVYGWRVGKLEWRADGTLALLT